MAVITLTTDFGKTEYVAQMKGVIHSIDPDAKVIDVAHDITPQNIFEGAFTLANTVESFKDAIHVAVVDPGVGGERVPIVIDCERGYLVGPDNGLLFPASHRLGFKACYEITNKEIMRAEISSTFHGRDIFAPVAAHLSRGIEVSEVGPEKAGLEKFMIEGFFVSGDKADGRIGRIDNFGNIITNIPRSMLKDKLEPGMVLKVKVKDLVIEARFVQTYSDGKNKEVMGLFSSSNFIEISAKNANVNKFFNSKPGDEIKIHFRNA